MEQRRETTAAEQPPDLNLALRRYVIPQGFHYDCHTEVIIRKDGALSSMKSQTKNMNALTTECGSGYLRPPPQETWRVF